MMKRKNILLRGLLAVAAAPMLLASCNSDEFQPEIQQYVTIGQVGVGKMEARAGYDATNNFLPTSSTDSLTLFVKSSLSDAKYSRDFLQFSCDGAKWTTKYPLEWGGSTAKWSAFYGATSKDIVYNSKSKKYELIIGYYHYEDYNRDLLYAYGTTTTGSLGINFKHLTAKLRYNIHIISGPDPIEKLRGIGGYLYASTVELNIGEELTLEPQDGSTAMIFKDHPELKVTPTNGATYSYEYLTLPIKSHFCIYGSGTDDPGHLGQNFAGINIESNKSYVFDVYIADDEILKADVTIKAWEDVENAANLETK